MGNKDKEGLSRGKKALLIIIALLVIVGATVTVTLKILNSDGGKGSTEAVNPDSEEVIRIEIPSGSSVKQIANILFENDLIKSEKAFTSEVDKSGKAMDLKAGNFVLSQNMDMYEILDAIISGKSGISAERLTIPEGYEIPRIANKIDEETELDSEVFLELVSDKGNFEDREGFEFLKELDEGQSLEGFLFPATYDIYPDTTEEDLVVEMLKAFESVYKNDIKADLEKSDMTLNEAITLASIIEREGKLDEERPIMSAVFHNRIKQGMPLQSCATVQYILGERKANLSTADTQIDSPFNTYINNGLPPGPIAAPGKVSMVSALNPEPDVDYLYFVLTGEDGSHTFSSNYDDHIKAKNNN